MIVNLHIEKLVLTGLPVRTHEGPLVGAAVSAELTRLFAQGGSEESFTSDRAVALARAAPVLAPEAAAEPLGAQIGRTIHGVLDR